MNSVISSASGVELSDPAREQAFDEIAGVERQRLFAVALSILRDDGEAQDAVQETLIKAWRSQDSLFRAESPSRWLTRVCVNHCISRHRYLHSRGWPPLDLSESPGPAGDPGSGAQTMDMDRAYRRLSLKQRAALTLNFVRALIDGGRKNYFAAMAGGFPTVHQHGSTCGSHTPLSQLPES